MKVYELVEFLKTYSREDENLDVIVWIDCGEWGNPDQRTEVEVFRHPVTGCLIIEAE